MRQVRSTTDTSGTGTRNAIPVSLPFSSGITFPTALAAPVEDGMMLVAAVRPPRQSLLDGPSTVFCVAVYACMVVIRPSMIVNLSLITLASGARQFVVHDALLQHHDINTVELPEDEISFKGRQRLSASGSWHTHSPCLPCDYSVNSNTKYILNWGNWCHTMEYYSRKNTTVKCGIC